MSGNKKYMSKVCWSPYQVAIFARSKKEAWQKLINMHPHVKESELRKTASIF